MKKIWLRSLVLMAAALQSCVLPDADRRVVVERDERFVYCGGEHRLRVVDLDMSPYPIADNQPIRALRVRVRADGTGECQTTFTVREREDRKSTRLNSSHSSISYAVCCL